MTSNVPCFVNIEAQVDDEEDNNRYRKELGSNLVFSTSAPNAHSPVIN